MTRKILHLDLDAFFCSVQEILDPSLRGKPFAVGGSPQGRGVVTSCSYAARRYGIHSAMPAAKALALFPQLIFVSGTHARYSDYSDKVMAILDDTSPLIQQVSIDEAFLDVTDMPQSGKTIAQDLQLRIRNEVDLPCSIGVATNKLVAKIANDFGKSNSRKTTAPCAITVVPPGTEAAFLAPLPVQALWGIGPKSAQNLKSLGIITIGDLGSLSDQHAVDMFGRHGVSLRDSALGIDDSPIHHGHEAKSVSNETTFSSDISDYKELLDTLRYLSEKVGARLRKSAQAGSTVHIKLRYGDFSTYTRQTKVPYYTNQDKEIYTAAKQLFDNLWNRSLPVRLLGVGVSDLGEPLRQLDFWSQKNDLREQQLLTAVDHLKEKFGKKIIQRASHLKPPDTGTKS